MILPRFSSKSTASQPSLLPSSSSSSNPKYSSSSSPALTNDSNSHHQQHDEEEHVPTSTTKSHLSLSGEYDLVVRANSYNEIRQWLIHSPDHGQIHLLPPPLRPNSHSVERALARVRPTKLTRLVSSYFRHTEHASYFLCYLLHSLHAARSLYKPLHHLISVTDAPPPMPSLSQPQCDRFFDVFVDFDLNFQCLDNPFPRPDSDTFFEIRRGFSQLKIELDRRLRRARSFLYSAVRIAAARCVITSRLVRKRERRIAQLDAANVGAYVVNNELDTINRLVARLHNVVESDEGFIKFGLERGRRDLYPIQEVVKQLRKSHPNLVGQMEEIEEHLCICLASVNSTRARLFQQLTINGSTPKL